MIKLLKYNINNTEQLKNALKMAWMEISHDTIQKLFESMSKRIRQVEVSLVIISVFMF